MKIRNILMLAAVTLCGLSACENDPYYYQDEARVRLVGDENWTLGTDSLLLSFTTIADTIDTAFVNVDAVIMGPVADHDRTVNLAYDASLTTADKKLFSFPETVVIPAGQSKATFKVGLIRDDILSRKTLRLYIKVVPSSDFNVGVNEQNHIICKWNKILIEPTYWASLEEFFGEYSDVKYNFILYTLAGKGYDVSDLNPETSGLNWSDLHNYQIILTNALNEYNTTHSPLTDENGKLVTF